MPYIDWQAQGICKFWMMGDEPRCTFISTCRWLHPPESERRRLWHDPHALERYLQHVNGPYGEGRAPPPPPTPAALEPRSIFERIERPLRDQRSRNEGERRDHGAVEAKPLVTPPWRKSTPVEASSSPTFTGATWDPTPSGAEAQHAVRQPFALPPKPAAISQNDTASVPPQPPRQDTVSAPPTSSQGSVDTMSTNANHEPLGRVNRLFALPANTPPMTSSPVTDVPAGARTVWRRPEAMQPGQADTMSTTQANATPKVRSENWERQRARKVAVQKKSEVEVEVRSSSRGAVVPRVGLEKPRAGADIAMPDAQSSTPPSVPKRSSPTFAEGNIPLGLQAKVLQELDKMGATKRMSNGEAKPPIGPHPSTIRVAARYISQSAVEKSLHPPAIALDVQERSLAEAREDSVRLQGVTWLDNTRRALQLPIRTFTTACAYYHRFRLAHPGATDYAWADAAAAALLMSCKAEDTLKKSRDILAAAYNIKASSHDALSADDTVFEAPSRIVIGLERLMLESSGFDFRSKYPHQLLVKICKSLPEGEEKRKVGAVAWTVATDLHRTFAPLKQTTPTMALACLELAAQLQAASSVSAGVVKKQLREVDFTKWATSREEIMETLLDLLDLYTHHTAGTILGTKYSLDDFLRIRLALNKECNEGSVPRFTIAPERSTSNGQQGATLQLANGHPTPVSPPQPGVQQQQARLNGNGLLFPALPEGGGTLRFMLNPQLAAEEKIEVQKYYVEEWEDYDEEIEVPLPRLVRSPSHDRHSNSNSNSGRAAPRERERPERGERHPPRPAREHHERRPENEDRRPAPPAAVDEKRSVDERRSRDDLRERDRDRERERERPRDPERERMRDRDRERDRDYERDRARVRDRERDSRRYEDRGYEERDRRYDDRRYEERDRYERRRERR